MANLMEDNSGSALYECARRDGIVIEQFTCDRHGSLQLIALGDLLWMIDFKLSAEALAFRLGPRFRQQQLVAAIAAHAGIGFTPNLPFASGADESALAGALFFTECLPRRVDAFDVWAMEHVVSWIAGAEEAAMLAALGAALGTPFADLQVLIAHLLTKKSYAPTHESAAVILMASAACRARAGQLLNALCDVLRDPANANTPLFARIPADSTATMHVFQFAPP